MKLTELKEIISIKRGTKIEYLPTGEIFYIEKISQVSTTGTTPVYWLRTLQDKYLGYLLDPGNWEIFPDDVMNRPAFPGFVTRYVEGSFEDEFQFVILRSRLPKSQSYWRVDLHRTKVNPIDLPYCYDIKKLINKTDMANDVLLALRRSIVEYAHYIVIKDGDKEELIKEIL